MKCYFACNSGVTVRDVYRDMLEVTLKTARQNTTLDLYCIYDGTPGDKAHRTLLRYDVTTIFHRITFEKELLELYTPEYMMQRYGRVEEVDAVIGTFSRMDLPLIETEDEYVLFADIDVMFLKDITQEDLPRPKYCAAAPEVRQDFDVSTRGHRFFNAGVMYLNIKGMREKHRLFIDMLKAKQPTDIECFDQGYLNHLCRDDFDELPLELNWKPYWGLNTDAKIVHLHSAKPNGSFRPDPFFDFVLTTFEDCIAGSIYYYLLFFESLGTNGNPWLIDHIDFLVCEKTKAQRKSQRRIKKKKIVRAAITTITTLLTIACIWLLSYLIFDM